MKKIAYLLLLVCLFVCLSSCSTTFNNSLLQATEGKITPLLPPLEIVNSSNSAVKVSSTASNQVTVNSYFYTIWEREVEQNICEDYGEKIGKIELVITNSRGSRHYSIPLTAIAIFGPGLVGFPFGFYDISVEFEIRIYDLEGNKIWKNVYSEQTKTVMNIFNEESDDCTDEAIIKVYRLLIQQAKVDIQRDRETIVSRLTK